MARPRFCEASTSHKAFITALFAALNMTLINYGFDNGSIIQAARLLQ